MVDVLITAESGDATIELSIKLEPIISNSIFSDEHITWFTGLISRLPNGVIFKVIDSEREPVHGLWSVAVRVSVTVPALIAVSEGVKIGESDVGVLNVPLPARTDHS